MLTARRTAPPGSGTSAMNRFGSSSSQAHSLGCRARTLPASLAENTCGQALGTAAALLHCRRAGPRRNVMTGSPRRTTLNELQRRRGPKGSACLTSHSTRSPTSRWMAISLATLRMAKLRPCAPVPERRKGRVALLRKTWTTAACLLKGLILHRTGGFGTGAVVCCREGLTSSVLRRICRRARLMGSDCPSTARWRPTPRR